MIYPNASSEYIHRCFYSGVRTRILPMGVIAEPLGGQTLQLKICIPSNDIGSQLKFVTLLNVTLATSIHWLAAQLLVQVSRYTNYKWAACLQVSASMKPLSLLNRWTAHTGIPAQS